MPSDPSRRPFIWVLLAATLVTGVCWGLVVPPFESADESVYYRALLSRAQGRPATGLPLYAIAMKPALVLAGGDERPFQARYNPAFLFVSNERGRVNMFMHGRLESFVRGDVNRMYLLRFLTLCLWMGALALIFETARLLFGRTDLALVTAGLCLFLPELSFFSAKIHPESTTVLLASAVYFALVARVFGRIGGVAAWTIVLTATALAPFSDRQAYFLLLLAPFGLVVTEPSRRRALMAAAVMLVPIPVVLALPQFAALRSDLVNWFAPFLPNYRFGWWTEDMSRYLAFEFAPKMFLGFVGWLGQPSILLPAAVYAVMGMAMALAVAGLFTRDARGLTREQRVAACVLGGGLFFTLAPIVYTNILIDRTSTGRWVYPSLAPIMIGLVAGFRAFVSAARRRPHRIAAVLVVVAGALAVAWWTAPGAAIRAGIAGNHYGDRDRLIRTIRDAIVVLVAAAAAIEIGHATARRVRWPRSLSATTAVFAGAWIVNLVLLFGFVRPLYQPLDAEGIATVVRAQTADGDYDRAGALYRLGLAAYPESATLRRLPSEVPLLLLNSGDDQMLADFRRRIGHGETLQGRAELMALARAVSTKGWLEPESLHLVVNGVTPGGDVGEALALLRLQLEGRLRDEAGAREVIHAGGGTDAPQPMGTDAKLEGFTVHDQPGPYSELVVYFRPLRDWAGRRLWVHAYPAGSHDYIVLDSAVTPFERWKPDELAWEVFRLPDDARFVLYTGVEISYNLGPAYRLGPARR